MPTYNLYALLVITVRLSKSRETPCESKADNENARHKKKGAIGENGDRWRGVNFLN